MVFRLRFESVSRYFSGTILSNNNEPKPTQGPINVPKTQDQLVIKYKPHVAELIKLLYTTQLSVDANELHTVTGMEQSPRVQRHIMSRDLAASEYVNHTGDAATYLNANPWLDSMLYR